MREYAQGETRDRSADDKPRGLDLIGEHYTGDSYETEQGRTPNRDGEESSAIHPIPVIEGEDGRGNQSAFEPLLSSDLI